MRFEDLDVWKRAARLSVEVYNVLGSFKIYSFRDQITRSALSISSNIAEGFERESKKECIQFLSYARGSCGEMRSQIYIGRNAKFIDKETGKRWIAEAIEISSMITGLIQTRRNFISTENINKS